MSRLAVVINKTVRLAEETDTNPRLVSPRLLSERERIERPTIEAIRQGPLATAAGRRGAGTRSEESSRWPTTWPAISGACAIRLLEQLNSRPAGETAHWTTDA